jgi:hypothetical protein
MVYDELSTSIYLPKKKKKNYVLQSAAIVMVFMNCLFSMAFLVP